MGIGIATLVINTAIAFIYLGQLKEMRKATTAATQASQTARETLNEMKTGSGAQDTHTLAQQAIAQSTQTGNLVIQAAAQARAIEAARRSSQEAANSALQAAIDNFHQEQRAWVGVESATPTGLQKGADGSLVLIMRVTLRNYGRSPAENVIFLPELLDFQLTGDALRCMRQPPPTPNLPGVTIFPGQTRDFDTSASIAYSDMEKSIRLHNPVIGRTLILMVAGCAEYGDDVTKPSRHHTGFNYALLAPNLTPETQGIQGSDMRLAANPIDAGPAD
jgi:hypothetical protein